MYFHRREIGVFTVLLGGIEGRKKSRKSDNSMKNGKGEEPSLPSAALDHLAAALARILGSAQ
jgi:hypothetical protein